MPITKIGVVYSKAIRNKRRVIIPSFDDSEIENVMHLTNGEDIWFMPIEDYMPIEIDGDFVPGWNVDANLAQYLGTWPLDDRCAVVNENGIVESVINADPGIDGIEGKTLILSHDAGPGWIYVDGNFVNPDQQDDENIETVKRGDE